MMFVTMMFFYAYKGAYEIDLASHQELLPKGSRHFTWAIDDWDIEASLEPKQKCINQ